MGGLGNQMFQISAAYALAVDNNDVAKFSLDSCYTPLQGHKASKYKTNIYKNIIDEKELKFSCIYEEQSHAFEEIQYRNNLLIKGYFQDERYFRRHKEQIMNLFHIDQKDKDSLNEKFDFVNKKYISVQIRRGDYLKFQDIHPTCSLGYFKEAMAYFGLNKNYIFVSDDIEWVKKNFIGDNYTYFEEDNEILAITALTMSEHNIISNSSFGWWGAYLNRNRNKIVVAPKIWFGPKGPKESEIQLKEWINI